MLKMSLVTGLGGTVPSSPLKNIDILKEPDRVLAGDRVLKYQIGLAERESVMEVHRHTR